MSRTIYAPFLPVTLKMEWWNDPHGKPTFVYSHNPEITATVYWKCGRDEFGIEIREHGKEPKRFTDFLTAGRSINQNLKSSQKYTIWEKEGVSLHGKHLGSLATALPKHSSSEIIKRWRNNDSHEEVLFYDRRQRMAETFTNEQIIESKNKETKRDVQERVVHPDGKVEERGIREEQSEQTVTVTQRIQRAVMREEREYKTACESTKEVALSQEALNIVFADEYNEMKTNPLCITALETRIEDMQDVDELWQLNLDWIVLHKIIATDRTKREYPKMNRVIEYIHVEPSDDPNYHKSLNRQWLCEFEITPRGALEPMTVKLQIPEVALRMHKPYERCLDAFIKLVHLPAHKAYYQRKVETLMPKLIQQEREIQLRREREERPIDPESLEFMRRRMTCLPVTKQ